MPTSPFQHLPLIQRLTGDAKLIGRKDATPQTLLNKVNRPQHSQQLLASVGTVSQQWKEIRDRQEGENNPLAKAGIPLLLKIDPSLELDDLRAKLAFEIVSEEDDGYVIVASEDIDLQLLNQFVTQFSTNTYGSGIIAEVYEITSSETQNQRLSRILSPDLYTQWPMIQDGQEYIVDVGIGGVGTHQIPNVPNRGKRDTDATWAQKEANWARARSEAYQLWDQIKIEREDEFESLVSHYEGEILNIFEEVAVDAVRLPDSFSVRIKISGRGLRDLTLNYPYIFEVVEPDDILVTLGSDVQFDAPGAGPTILAPSINAPAVCVIDSGIQEAHPLLASAIDTASSWCYLPDKSVADVADQVPPGGHGTRVAGAVLFGEVIPEAGEYQAEHWIQNARILDERNSMPNTIFPPAAMREIVRRYNEGEKPTRIFNHSINARSPCRLKHMSAWAAELDKLSDECDVLFIQSAGNVLPVHDVPFPGISEHLLAGRNYPSYLSEPTCRVANPAQSLQAITVGSVSYDSFNSDGWASFSPGEAHPSSFSRSGFALWNVVKPELVEFGGDFLHTENTPADIGTPSHAKSCYPHLVRSTMLPGPLSERDAVGTSFAAPKVAHIAAALEQALPEEPCLMYRALLVQSARWPDWAQRLSPPEQLQVLKRIGYGLPNKERATANSPHRCTFIISQDKNSNGGLRIKPKEAHVYQVPIPAAMRRPGDDFDILIEVTLSYSSQPRRTRRKLRRYLSTWVDWKASKLGESLESFTGRVVKNDEDTSSDGNRLPWTLHESPDWGRVRGAKRNAGTVQKDWATVKSNELPEDFCIAVVGHEGWNSDPDATAQYALAVSFEIVGREIEIYQEMKTSLETLQTELEADQFVEIEF